MLRILADDMPRPGWDEDQDAYVCADMVVVKTKMRVAARFNGILYNLRYNKQE